ncbi:MAG: hypothetical protein SFY81_16440 [Verrucomicrobiota bacterium]|nr:hypothetical protein [Verrucomicrobiota bacterium]
MADPENSPIAKLLKEQARKRREAQGTSFELHSATRHALQEEVARTFQESPRKRFAWLPKFKWALSMAAILMLCVVVLKQKPQRSEPMSGESALKLEGNVSPSGATANDNKRAESLEREAFSKDLLITASSAEKETPVSRYRDEAAADQASESFEFRGGTPRVKLEDRSTLQEAKQGMAEPVEMLRRFEATISGEKIELRDEDGSLYLGRIEPLVANKDAAFTTRALEASSITDAAAPPAAQEKATLQPEALSFTAEGSNQFNQPIQLRGRLFFLTQSATSNQVRLEGEAFSTNGMLRQLNSTGAVQRP